MQKPGKGRPRLWSDKILLTLTAEMLAAIEAGLKEGENRLDFIRQAIDEKLARRKKGRD